jgi:F-type H+-transporting ATPase subunit epsilon
MAVVPGEAVYQTANGDRETVIVSDGLLKVENGEVMILVDTAEKPEDIDEARARRAEEQAREDLKRANNNRDMAIASAEISRAMSRIKASKKKHRL